MGWLFYCMLPVPLFNLSEWMWVGSMIILSEKAEDHCSETWEQASLSEEHMVLVTCHGETQWAKISANHSDPLLFQIKKRWSSWTLCVEICVRMFSQD
jgi:hypothetical protein